MPNCPRCTQRVKQDAISCPSCGQTLAAYGHPGIPLHQTAADTSLCQTCTYEQDRTCTFPQRPHAQSCTLYRDYRRKISPRPQKKRKTRTQVYPWLLGLACIIVIAILLAR